MVKEVVRRLGYNKRGRFRFSSKDRWVELVGFRVSLKGLREEEYGVLEACLELGDWELERVDGVGGEPLLYKNVREVYPVVMGDRSSVMMVAVWTEHCGLVVYRLSKERLYVYIGVDSALDELVRGVDRSLRGMWGYVKEGLQKRGVSYDVGVIKSYRREYRSSRDMYVPLMGLPQDFIDLFVKSIDGVGDIGVKAGCDCWNIYVGSREVGGRLLHRIVDIFPSVISNTWEVRRSYEVGDLRDLPSGFGIRRNINFNVGVSGKLLDVGSVKVKNIERSRYVLLGWSEQGYSCYDKIIGAVVIMNEDELKKNSKQIHNVYLLGGRVQPYKGTRLYEVKQGYVKEV